MNNLVVLPILLPLITGVLALLFFRRVYIQRFVSVVGLLGALRPLRYLSFV